MGDRYAGLCPARGINSSVRPRRGHKMSVGGSPLPPIPGRQSPLGPAKGTAASA